jgi:hypothetical protein
LPQRWRTSAVQFTQLRLLKPRKWRAFTQSARQASDKRVGTKIEDVFSLNDLRDDQELEVLPPGSRSDRLFFEELFFAVD